MAVVSSAQAWILLTGVLIIAALWVMTAESHSPHRVERQRWVGPRLSKRGRHVGGDETADAAMLLDLCAELLSAGVGLEAALSRLASAVPGAEDLARVHHAVAAGARWDQAMRQVEGVQALETFCEHLSFAYATGAPSASMLQAAASQARMERRHQAEQKAEELGVRMMFPLGACFLPAFVLLGVVPVVISMVPEGLL